MKKLSCSEETYLRTKSNVRICYHKPYFFIDFCAVPFGGGMEILMAKKTAYYGIMLAVAMVFSYAEILVSLPLPVPGIKLGLANLVVIILLYNDSPFTAFTINFSRIVLTGILFGNIQTVVFSFCGGILSLFVMMLFKQIKLFSIIGVSIAGGVAHIIGQMAAAVFVLGTAAVLYYLPFLVLTGALTGCLIGFLSGIVFARIQNFKD